MPGRVDDSSTSTSTLTSTSSSTSTKKDSSTTSSSKDTSKDTTSKSTSKTSSTTSTKSMSTTSAPATTPIIRSNLGPLTTTTWTPPAQCTYFGPGGNVPTAGVYFLAQSCDATAPHDATGCWPPATTTVGDPDILFGYGFYSPGIVCPPGYTQACAQAPPFGELSGSVSKLKSFSFQYDQVDGETAIGCCPTGMTCTNQGGGYQTCGVVTSDISISIGICSGDSSKYAHVSKISIHSADSFYGPLIQLMFQATDTQSVSSSTTMATSVSTGAPASASTSAAANADDGSSGGLSNGAKIGIGVGVPLGFLLLAGLAFFFLFRRRRQRQRDTPMEMPYGSPNGNNVEKNTPAPRYGPLRSAKELAGAHGTSELDSNMAPVLHELPTDAASPR